MSLKERMIQRQLKAMGIDISNPSAITFKSIRDLISTSIPSLIKPKDMIDFLNVQIEKLKHEYGE